jgi:hypothetical protein
MPASEYSCRKAKSFFEEYAALPDIVGQGSAVKKVGLGRVLSIKYSFCLSSFSFFPSAADSDGCLQKFRGGCCCAATGEHQSQLNAPPV